jgi:hypothetical protein
LTRSAANPTFLPKTQATQVAAGNEDCNNAERDAVSTPRACLFVGELPRSKNARWADRFKGYSSGDGYREAVHAFMTTVENSLTGGRQQLLRVARPVLVQSNPQTAKYL